jgi:hypothetical protein
MSQHAFLSCVYQEHATSFERAGVGRKEAHSGEQDSSFLERATHNLGQTVHGFAEKLGMGTSSGGAAQTGGESHDQDRHGTSLDTSTTAGDKDSMQMTRDKTIIPAAKES